MKRTRLYLVLFLAVTASRAAGQPSTSAPAVSPEALVTQNLARALYERSSGISRNVTALPMTEQAVLVVPTARMEAETFVQLGEDMNIMCRVMDRLLASAGLKLRDWPPFVPPDQRRATRGVYLPGFGAVLLVDVDFPLVAPPEDTPEPDVQQQADTLWSEIRQQMRGQPAPADTGRDTDKAAAYDDLKLESLKRTFLAALKHASNIRGLDPNDHIVAVAANAPHAAILRNQVFATTDAPYGMERSPAERSSPQLLVLRATKSRVDAYADGTLTPEQFRKEAGVINYDLSTVESAAPPRP